MLKTSPSSRRASGGLVLGGAGEEVGEGPEAGGCRAREDEALRRDRRQPALDALDDRSVSGVGDHHDGVGIAEQAGEGRGVEERAHGHDHRANLGDRPVQAQQLEAVGQDRRHLVVLDDPDGQQPIGQAVDTFIEGRIAQPLALEHDGGMRRPVGRVPRDERPDVHLIRSAKP